MTQQAHKPVHVGNAWRVVLADLGIDEQTFLRRADLPLTTLRGDGSYLSVDQYYGLYDVLEELSDDDELALKAGSVVSVEMFDPAIFAALCSPNMNVAASRLGQFKRLVGSFSLDVSIDVRETSVRYRCKHRPDVPRILGLVEMVFQVAFARRATRERVVPLRVSVQRLPDDLGPYEAFFGTPILEDEVVAVTFAAEDARRPFLTHNDRMWESFEPALKQRMKAAAEHTAVVDQVQTALLVLLPSGRTQLKDVAKELGMTPRTLQRRLAAEETSWLKLLNETRQQLAHHYLRTSKMSPAEVSFLLGFEDPNSLFRAFHRWTGTTPESWRSDSATTG